MRAAAWGAAMGMAENPEGTASRRDPPAAAGRRGAGMAAFELWLQQRLHELYDDVMREPIPPELLRLIEADRVRRRG